MTSSFVPPNVQPYPASEYNTATYASKTSLSIGVRSIEVSRPLPPSASRLPSRFRLVLNPSPPPTRCPMPIIAVSIFATIYGGFAVGLTCVEFFTRPLPVAMTTNMASSGSRSRARAPPAQRKKNKPKQPWWKIWGKSRRASSRQEPGVPEPPQPRPQPSADRRVVATSTNYQSNNFVDLESDLVFAGFTAEHPAVYVNPLFVRTVNASRHPANMSHPRLKQQRKHLKPNKLKKLKSKLKSKLKPKGSEQPLVKPNVVSFSREYELIRSFKNISQGAVHLVKHRGSGERFIIKQTPVPDEMKHCRHYEPDEASVLLHALEPHKNILRCVGCSKYYEDDEPMFNIVFEYCDAGDLEAYVNRADFVPEQFTKHFISSMIDTLAFLHSGDVDYDPESDTTFSIQHRQQAYLHRDIKPLNIFLKWEPDASYGLPTVVLGDFGFVQLESETSGIAYTYGYVAPELAQRLVAWKKTHSKKKKHELLTGAHTQATDIFAFGVSLWELTTHSEFISGRTHIRQGFETSLLKEYPVILNLLEACLSPNPARRPKVSSLHRLSAQFKAQNQAWYDCGGRLPASIWSNPFGLEQRALQESFDRGSSHYSVVSATAKSTTRPRARVSTRHDGLRTRARQISDDHPTIALFPSDVDPRTLKARRPAMTTPQHGEPSTTAESLTNLFTGQPAGDAEISSTNVEASDLAADGPVSAFSGSSTDTEYPLYF